MLREYTLDSHSFSLDRVSLSLLACFIITDNKIITIDRERGREREGMSDTGCTYNCIV